MVNATSVNDALVAGGLGRGGTITGIEVVTEANGQNLYAVDDNGGLYVVPRGTLGDLGSATDWDTRRDSNRFGGDSLFGFAFRANSVSTMASCVRLCLESRVRATFTPSTPQVNCNPFFAGGRSMISTGIVGAQGLDFSTLGFNLWHTTNQRGDDLGHGIERIFSDHAIPSMAAVCESVVAVR